VVLIDRHQFRNPAKAAARYTMTKSAAAIAKIAIAAIQSMRKLTIRVIASSFCEKLQA
jgi:hypothetical protein